MNAAILLVSSAWMVGQTPEVIIPVSHNSCGTSCGASCCDSGPRLLDRIRGLFQRDCCNPCPQPRCHEVRCHEPRCHQPRCHEPRCHVSRCHNDCDPCHGPSLFDRIRSAFHRDCCDAGCRTACCTSGAAPAAEPLKEQPKKMPSKSEPKKAADARVITSPAQAPLPAIQNAPAIAPAPAVAPRILENDTRNPF